MNKCGPPAANAKPPPRRLSKRIPRRRPGDTHPAQAPSARREIRPVAAKKARSPHSALTNNGTTRNAPVKKSPETEENPYAANCQEKKGWPPEMAKPCSRQIIKGMRKDRVDPQEYKGSGPAKNANEPWGGCFFMPRGAKGCAKQEGLPRPPGPARGRRSRGERTRRPVSLMSAACTRNVKGSEGQRKIAVRNVGPPKYGTKVSKM